MTIDIGQPRQAGCAGGRGQGWFRSPDLMAALALAALGCAFFSDFLFSSKNFFFRDILNFHYPLRKAVIEAYARGEFPLWNPFLYFGQPMLANPNCLAFYPTNLFHALFSFNYAFKLHFVIHPILGGLGAYFMLRRLGVTAIASFGGAAIYQHSGAVLSFLNLYNLVPAVGLMPWMAWAFLRSLKGGARPLLLFGAIMGIQGFAPEPFLVQCELWLLAGLALHHAWEAGWSSLAARTVSRTLALGGSLAAGISAAQTLPTVEMLPHSIRGEGLDPARVIGWSLHPLDLLNTVVPNLFGHPYTIVRDLYWGEAFHGAREGYLVSYFLGVCALSLSLLAAASKRRRLTIVLWTLTLLGVLLALVQLNPVSQWLYHNLFFLQLGRYPSKFFLLSTLGLAALAALGFEVLVEASGREPRAGRRAAVLVSSLGLVCAAGCLGLWATLQQHPGLLQDWLRARVSPPLTPTKDFQAIGVGLLASIRWTGQFALLTALVILAVRRLRRPWLTGALVTLVLLAEVLPMNIGLTPLISDADVEFVPEVNKYLEQRKSERCRVLPMDSPVTLPIRELRAPNRSSAWLTLFYRRSGQPMYGIMQGIEYSVFISIDRLNTSESNELFLRFTKLWRTNPVDLLRRTNTCTLLTISEVRDPRVGRVASFDTGSERTLGVYHLDGALPRAYFVSGVREVPTQEAALEELLSPAFPAERSVLLEGPGHGERAPIPDAGAARILSYEAARVALEVEAKSDGHLVLLDSYYPGWQARVDGRDAEVKRANYAFRAVAVPAGRHRLEFVYRPLAFRAGLWISVLTVLIGGGLPLWGRARRRAAGE